LYTNFASPDISHEEITNNILRTEAEYFGTPKWGVIFDVGIALSENGLPYRQFTTFSEYENTNTVKGCVSLKLLMEQRQGISNRLKLQINGQRTVDAKWCFAHPIWKYLFMAGDRLELLNL
jgi:hypothetical protein